jgi:hypothetical protein
LPAVVSNDARRRPRWAHREHERQSEDGGE